MKICWRARHGVTTGTKGTGNNNNAILPHTHAMPATAVATAAAAATTKSSMQSSTHFFFFAVVVTVIIAAVIIVGMISMAMADSRVTSARGANIDIVNYSQKAA